MLKKVITYFLGNVLSRVIVFALLPIYSKYISPSDYGYYDIVNTYVIFLSSVLCMEIWTTMLRFVFDKKDMEGKYESVKNATFLLFASIIIFISLILLANLFIPLAYLLLVILYAVSLCCQNFFSYIARAFGKNVLFAVSGIASSVTYVGLNLILILGFKFDYSALYISFIAGSLIQCLIVGINVRPYSHLNLCKFNLPEIRSMLKFSWPLGVNIGAFWFLNSYSKTAIVNAMGTEVNGYFSMGAKFGAIIQFLSACLIMAWQEKAFEQGSKDGQAKFFGEMISTYIKLIFCGGAIIIPIVFLIYPLLIDEQYQRGMEIVPTFILATIMSVFASFLTAIFAAIKKTYNVFITTLVGAIVNIIAVHTLIPSFGINAAAISMVCGFAACILMRLWKIKNLIGTEINWINIGLNIIPCTIIAIVCFYSNSVWINVFSLFCLLILFIIINKREVKHIVSQFTHLFATSK